MTAIILETSNTLEKQVKAAIVGKMCEEPAQMAVIYVGFGGTRMIDMLVGDPLPRTC